MVFSTLSGHERLWPPFMPAAIGRNLRRGAALEMFLGESFSSDTMIRKSLHLLKAKIGYLYVAGF